LAKTDANVLLPAVETDDDDDADAETWDAAETETGLVVTLLAVVHLVHHKYRHCFSGT
jgi:hypothetical protein